MSDELEPRLERLLGRLPGPSAETGERALRTALAALPEHERQTGRGVRTLALLAAALLVLLAVSAGALAKVGALHVSLGQPSAKRPSVAVSPPRLAVPKGAHGIAAVVDGRLWLTTRSGLRIEGLPVDSAALSPHALYVAAGIGDALVAMAPTGRRAWSQPTIGPVVAIAWAPNGLRIAYVVKHRGGFQLRRIEGNGRNDRLLDGAVRPVRPSWRADSLAVAYVGAGGRPVVYDLGHRSRRVIRAEWAEDATRLAFAARGKTLAVASAHRYWVVPGQGAGDGGDFAPANVAGLGWLHGELAVALNPPRGPHDTPYVQLFEIAPNGEAVPYGSLEAPARIRSADIGGGRIMLAVAAPADGVRLLAASARDDRTRRPLPQPQLLLDLAAGTSIRGLSVR
ncbi:MAG TPA: hypothetical protein VFI37_12085 [Gaiellaceae bacterium]|nr:hypothetical protein [Gaiellaceae bacterium]